MIKILLMTFKLHGILNTIVGSKLLAFLVSAQNSFPFYSRYYFRRGGYVRRPRRYRWF
jgi:hypothetical protein